LHPLEYFLWQATDLLQTATEAGENASVDTPPLQPEPFAPAISDSATEQPVTAKITSTDLLQKVLTTRRKALMLTISREYEKQLVTLQRQWHQLKLATAYYDTADQPPDEQQQQKLTALMLYIDRYVTNQLQVNQEDGSYIFEEHFQFSKSYTRFWSSVMQGINILAGLDKQTESQSAASVEALASCLASLSVDNKNPQSQPCQSEIINLKEKIIVSFSQSVKL
jgi:hypothetical protein